MFWIGLLTSCRCVPAGWLSIASRRSREMIRMDRVSLDPLASGLSAKAAGRRSRLVNSLFILVETLAVMLKLQQASFLHARKN
jgi:hypothetical protein